MNIKNKTDSFMNQSYYVISDLRSWKIHQSLKSCSTKSELLMLLKKPKSKYKLMEQNFQNLNISNRKWTTELAEMIRAIIYIYWMAPEYFAYARFTANSREKAQQVLALDLISEVNLKIQ